MNKLLLLVPLCLTCVSLGAKPRFITYEQYGAKGDGHTDDMPAIVAAHKAANEKGLPVRAKDGKTYFISNAPLTAEIRTDTDFGKAKFIIDDVGTEGIRKAVFTVLPDEESFQPDGLRTLYRGQTNLGTRLPCRCLVEVMNNGHKVFIRKGLNQNSGTAQKEVLLVDKDGSIDPSTPVVFNYDQITSVKAWPVGEKPISLKGGTFTTIANQCENTRMYHARGITVKRSNTRIEGITHLVAGELDHGAPYGGFILLDHVTGVVVSDCLMTGHKTYVRAKGAAGKPVRVGTYDLNASCSAGILWKNCRQTNSIDDTTYWGVFTSNFCKDLRLEDCSFSRFDAHQSVTNVRLKGCTFGHMAVRMVGYGTIRMEDCEEHANYLLALRDDYGSTWDGDIIVRNCIIKPNADVKEVFILKGGNNGSHDFGYPCSLPSSLTVEGLVIDDSAVTSPNYKGPSVLSSFSRKTGAEEPFPFKTDCIVNLSALQISSGKPLSPAPNPGAFPGLVVRGETH
ncbi:MAG: hypothetical protein IJV01_00160 [Bacteroidales bacterium]|nr:hypothetical protein [Bacteroidales bacterium]